MKLFINLFSLGTAHPFTLVASHAIAMTCAWVAPYKRCFNEDIFTPFFSVKVVITARFYRKWKCQNSVKIKKI